MLVIQLSDDSWLVSKSNAALLLKCDWSAIAEVVAVRTTIQLEKQTFCYVDDLVEAVRALMDSPEGMTGPVNIGNPEEYSILELAQLIVKLTNSKSEIVRIRLPQDDPEKRRPDISLAKTTLGWHPKVKLVDGLINTIAYFSGQLRSLSR